MNKYKKDQRNNSKKETQRKKKKNQRDQMRGIRMTGENVKEKERKNTRQ